MQSKGPTYISFGHCLSGKSWLHLAIICSLLECVLLILKDWSDTTSNSGVTICHMEQIVTVVLWLDCRHRQLLCYTMAESADWFIATLEHKVQATYIPSICATILGGDLELDPLLHQIPGTPVSRNQYFTLPPRIQAETLGRLRTVLGLS